MNDTLERLKYDILTLEGYKPRFSEGHRVRPFQYAFPNNTFPIGAIHELICTSDEDIASTEGFIAGLLCCINQQQTSLWISPRKNVFAPALKLFGLDPDKFIFVKTSSSKDLLWIMEEALKCEQLAAVIGEIKNVDFTASRRLQLAVEQSSVNGFIIRQCATAINTITSIARWKITSLPSEPINGLPGVGFPRWNVELLKVRNGKPQSWQVEWVNGSFKSIAQKTYSIAEERMYKVG